MGKKVPFLLGFTFAVFTSAAWGGGPPVEGTPFRRGDVNADGQVDISDAISTLSFLFLGGEVPPCVKSADSDDTGSLDITDPIHLLSFLFIGGSVPPAPGPHVCGPDPTGDALDCLSYAACLYKDEDSDGMDDEWENLHFGGLGHGGADDNDLDGLTDLQESKGWKVVLDLHGYGTDAMGSLMTIRTVTSNPNLADSDGDGLKDGEEFNIRTDPIDPDSDGDGLGDEEEWRRWLTSPTSVDTDGDSRGPGRDQAPNQALFDGNELRLLGTSPTLDDTDGDGRTDYEEFDHPLRSPLVADLPRLELEIADAVDVRLDVEFAEEQGKTKQYGGELRKNETSSVSNYSGHTIRAGVEVGFTQKVELVKPEWETSIKLSFGYEHQWSTTTESSSSVETSRSEYLTDALTRTETAASGSLTMGIRLKNSGNITYTLADLGITVRQWRPGINPDDPELGGSFKTVCTLAPELGGMPGDITRGITLAPGEITPVLLLEDKSVNASRIKDLLARPDSLYLEPAFYQIENAEGLDFDFLEEVTASRTARVIIDRGDGYAEEYRVATNVERYEMDPDDSTPDPYKGFSGVTLSKVLGEILGIAYKATAGDLVEVDGLKNSPETPGSWSIILTPKIPMTLPARFEDIAIHAGDTALIVFITDLDGDGLSGPEEQHFGMADGASPDTDGDGLTDSAEVRGTLFEQDDAKTWCSWTVTVNGGAAHPVWSDPRKADADGDGLTDRQEKELKDRNGLAAATDPRNRDTDGDGLWDGQDPYPTTSAKILYVNAASAGTPKDGLDWAHAYSDLQAALDKASTSNGNSIAGDDIAEIWVAAGTYVPPNTVTKKSFTLVDKVGVYGGFVGNETKRSQRSNDPLLGGAVLSGETNSSQYVVLAGTAVSSSAVLDGFMIQGAEAGTGLYCNGGQPHLVNLIILDNNGPQGAGVSITVDKDGGMALENCIITVNTTTGHGGGLFIQNTGKKKFSLTLEGCMFKGNTCSVAGKGGGGAYIQDVDARLERCRFLQNVGYNMAGGIMLYNMPTARVIDCEFSENLVTQVATAQDQDLYAGGGIYVDAMAGLKSDVLVANCMIWKNGACNGGGIFIYGNSSFSIINSSIADNYDTKSHTASNSHCGGIKVQGVNDTGSVRNSILYGNASTHWYRDDMPWLTQICDHGDYRILERVILQNSCVQGSETRSPGRWLISDDPGFVKSASGDLRLNEDSPCIDRGDNFVDFDPMQSGFQSFPETDLNGRPRIVDGDGDGEAVVDLGACEFQKS